MSDLWIANCALCGGEAWLHRDHGCEFQGPNGPQQGTARYIACAGSRGPVNPETGELDEEGGDWDNWQCCDPDGCETFDEEHGGAYGAGEGPCVAKWNAMQTSIIEARELEATTRPAPAASGKGGRL